MNSLICVTLTRYNGDIMGALPDWKIEELDFIKPFSPGIKRENQISYGVTSYGYDVRIGNKFKVFSPINCFEIDPKNFDTKALVDVEVKDHDYLLIPPHSFALGESIEEFDIPRNVTCIVVGKSTYARCGIIVNVTPLEACMSSDTEVLTREGWRLLSDVLIGQEILTRTQEGIAEYQPVQRKQERYVNEELNLFDGRSVNQLVTDDHKIPVWFRHKTRKTENYIFEIKEAKDIFNKWNYSFDRKVNWKGENCPKTIKINDIEYPAEEFLYFFGCWLGDGSAYKSTDGGYLVKLAVVTKERKRNNFRTALKNLNIKYYEHERGVQFYNKNLCKWLMQYKLAKNKKIPRDFLQYSPELLKHLLQGLLDSDGSKTTNTYTTISKHLANDVQELMFKCGHAAIIRTVNPDETNSKFISKNPIYLIRMSSVQFYPKMNPTNHKKEHYKGFVYDVTVPNHIFLSRRCGKVSWTGNCWKGKVTIEISNTTPLPARIYAGEGIMQAIFIKNTDETLVCKTSYKDKKGKYQNQTGIEIPKVDK